MLRCAISRRCDAQMVIGLPMKSTVDFISPCFTQCTMPLCLVYVTMSIDMRMHCHHCGGMVRAREIRCPYCHRSTLSWLHLTAIVALAISVVVLAFRTF